MTAEQTESQPQKGPRWLQFSYIRGVTDAAARGELTGDQAVVAMAMATLADNDTGELVRARSSYRAISERSGRTHRTVRRTLEQLVELSLAARTPHLVNGSLQGWDIILQNQTGVCGDTGVTPDRGSVETGGLASPPTGVTPDRGRGSVESTQTNSSTNSLSNSSRTEGVPTVVPRASAAPERKAEPAPPLRFDGEVDDWGVEAPTDESMRLARGLVKYLEATYLETGHRSTDLAALLAPLLDSERWDADAIRAEVKRSLPAVRGRFRGRTERAITALLGDMAEPGYGTRPGRSPEKKLPNVGFESAETDRWSALFASVDAYAEANAVKGVA